MRPRSGVETLALLRFTLWCRYGVSLNRTEITVEQGALLINSSLSNQVNLLGPESKLSVSGVGSA